MTGKQVPHWAFGPVRNDKGLFWWVALRGAEEPLFHSGDGGAGDFGEVQDKVKGKINVKSSGQSLP